MSTEIKPGQIWADKNGARLRVDLVRPAHVEFTWLGGIMHVLRTEEFLDAFELVEDTPAPRDPTAVEPEAVQRARAVVAMLRDARADFITRDTALDMVTDALDGPEVIAAEEAAHQPAPEPEPEWKPGETVADINVGCFSDSKGIRAVRREGGWRSANGNWDDANVNDVRPLVVIDPAAGWWAEIHNAFVAAGIGDAGSAASIALRTLGIEVPA